MSDSPVIFLAFANSSTSPLLQLTKEDDALYQTLHERAVNQHHFHLHRDSHTTLDKLRFYLTEFQDRVFLFHYAGHADSEKLFLKSGSANSGGLAEMLAEQSRLKLVFLNGCSTQAQVAYLLELGVPAVIATSAPIDDEQAGRFAVWFYRALHAGNNLQEAYDQAASYLRASGAGVEHRSLYGFEEAESAQNAVHWGLYTQEGSSKVLEWKLPSSRLDLNYLLKQQLSNKPYEEVNDHIILPLFKAIQQHHPHISLPEDEDGHPDELKIQDLIIENFPLPIGEQIRKLFANTEEMFSLSLARLHQLIRSYEVSSKFLCYLLLSYLWDQIHQQKKIEISDYQQNELNLFFHLDGEVYQRFDFIALAQVVLSIFYENNVPLFVEEFQGIYVEMKKDGSFWESYLFLQKVRSHLAANRVLAQDLEEFCRQGEYHLSIILQKIAFLSTYRLITVKDILLKKERMMDPAYAIQMGILKGTDAKRIKPKEREYEQFTDTQSVLFIKNVKDLTQYQSLSPFIIDENAFSGHPNFKIFFFDYAQGEDYYYKFVDTGRDALLISEEKFPHIYAQLKRFRSDIEAI